MDAFNRVKLLIGNENYEKLKSSHVAVFGCGGVGGYVIEALGRSGVGEITIIDNDKVSLTNINRQIIALNDNIGQLKTDSMKARLLSINPIIKVHIKDMFFLPENSEEIDFTDFSYVVDAVDTVTAKLEIIKKAKENNVKVISCMGTGGKLDPTKLEVTTIEKTEGDPLSRVMRRELKSRGIRNVKVIYSKEKPIESVFDGGEEELKGKRQAPPSMIFVPASAGLLIAKEVISELIK